VIRTTRFVRGITALELLIIAAVAAVLVAFAVPIVSYMMSKSDMEQAINITESSIQSARDAARFYNTDVLIHLEMDEEEKQQSIVLSIPALQKDPALNEVTEDFALPLGFQVYIDGEIIHFEPTGEVEFPAHVKIVSNSGENPDHQLVID
jgi:ABC-type Na+ efflux pump permease subunit